MKRLYERLLRYFVSILVNRFPQKCKDLLSPRLRAALLGLVIYFDTSRLKGIIKSNNFENLDDVYQPSAPIEWIRQLFQFRSIEKKSKILVIIHAYYLELLPEILIHLKYIPEDFDLIITNSSGLELSISDRDLPSFCQKNLTLQNLLKNNLQDFVL
jgi:hypothetical protein